MALLTEEQINDILDITNVCFSSSSAKKLLEWNEKQHIKYDLCNFLIDYQHDWDNNFPKPKRLELKAFFYDENGNEIERLCSSQERPVTPHPHAALMTKYAEVAQRRVDPWVEFEQYYYCDEHCWFTLEVPTFFDAHLEYRHIGDDK